MSQGFGPVGSTKETRVTVDLEKAVESIPGFDFGKDYEWGVLLVELAPTYRRVAHLETGSRFVVAGASGGGDGNSSSGATKGPGSGK